MAFTLDSEDFDWKATYTVDNTKIDGTLTDKDCYIDLSDFGADFWDNVKSDGGDIRVSLSDETTRVPVEVKSLNTTANTGQVWFKGSSISSSVDTVFTMFWGNATATQPGAATTYGSENVWDVNYVLVAHLEESGNGTADEFKDSTSNANHGQGGGGTASKVPDKVTAFLGSAQDHISGNADHINWGNASSLDGDGSTNFSFEVLVNHDVVAAHHVYLIRASANGSGTIPYEFRLNTASKVHFRTGSDIKLSTATLSASTDYHIAATQTTGTDNSKIYINGALDSSHTLSNPPSAYWNLTSGAMDNTTNYNKFDGKMDEIRISRTSRSAAWIKATHANLLDRSNFYTLGTPEESVGVAFIPTIMIF